MADIWGAGHGGDAGGNDNPWNWQPPSGCKAIGASNKPPPRGSAKNKKLNKAYKANGHQPLDIDFDRNRSWRQVGRHASIFASFLGSLARSIPFYYDSWEHVPAVHKDRVWGQIHRYFNLDPFLNRNESDKVRIGVQGGIEHTLSERYRRGKAEFKKTHFDKNQPPVDLPEHEWQEYVDFFNNQRRLGLSQRNTENRSKQTVGTHGRKSIAQYHEQSYNSATQQYESDIETWRHVHQRRGSFVDNTAHQYELMRQLRNQLGPDVTDRQIMDMVLERRSGWERGIGRKVKGTSSSTAVEESQSEDDDSGNSDGDASDGGDSDAS